MAILLESILLKGLLYFTTVLATLRAGSRALYALGHGGTIGLMDGPLILGPEDVQRLGGESCHHDLDDQFRDDMDDDPIQVSPLWEPTYAFQQAVKLLYNLDDRDRARINNLGVSSTTKDERNIIEGYYSMAAPHKSYQTPAFVAPTTSDNNTSFSSNVGEQVEEEDKRLIVLNNDEMEIPLKRSITEHIYFRNLMLNSLQKLKRVSTDAITIGIHTSNEIRKICFPPIWYSNGGKDKKRDSEEKPLADHDIILATTVDIPCTGTLNISSDLPVKKVAHVKAFAPRTFRTLRSWFGINENDFITSIAENGPFVSFQSNSKGAARVGKLT